MPDFERIPKVVTDRTLGETDWAEQAAQQPSDPNNVRLQWLGGRHIWVAGCSYMHKVRAFRDLGGGMLEASRFDGC